MFRAKNILAVKTLYFLLMRINHRFHVSDIVPPAESGEDASDILWKVHFYSSPRYFLISTRYGQIRDPEAFAHIFGDTS